MYVKIMDIVNDRKVLVQVEDSKFIAEWDGDKVKKNISYEVEMDIDDELVWKTNIYSLDENKYSISQKDNGIKMVGKLDYNSKDNLATLKVYGSIILINLQGIEKDLSNKWVEINCNSIKLYNINL